MGIQTWRERVGGWGFFLVGSVGSLYSVTQWGMDASMLTALFGILTLGGILVIRGRLNAFYYLLPAVGILALFEALAFYLNQGITTLTLAFVLLGIVSLGKAVQAYRRPQVNREI
ncbi:hypothetical protein SAMN05192552_10423 [Natrinema hispanicum]|uniref:DUF2157 domain-containing protein n=1 Tax=Natrinema hispanicum TaxID=392421 RepID=A0A1G6WZA6_9EURY|nr:hypothetical protein SAMN05192552_10423 [Natrinema hispanicum]SEU07485.1 hypothetical protein SAMN04488694_13726 [Natrinema hispanicum]